LLIDHAREAELGTQITPDEILSLTRILVHAHDLADATHSRLEHGRATILEVLAYMMQAGAYYERPALLNTFARSFNLFIERARSNDEHAVSLDEWSVADYKTTLEEQLAGGFGYSAVAHVLDKEPNGQTVLLDSRVLTNTALRDREEDIARVLTADRVWFREQFAKGDQSVRDIAWEVTPFLRRPFLRLTDGRLVLVSPGAINYWVGQGFYDRLRESAKSRKTKQNDTLSAFGSYYGDLVERYALDLIRSVYPADRVHGEVRYGKGGGLRTPDVAIHHGSNLILIEVRSGVLSPWFRTSGELDEFQKQLDRLVISKINQLGRRLADLKRGTGKIPGVDPGSVARVWPVLTTASLTQSEFLYDWVQTQLPAAFREDDVRPLIVLDIEDLEILMGLVEDGRDLVEMFESWQTGPYPKLGLKRFAIEELGAAKTTRARITTETWARVTEAMKGTLGWWGPKLADSM
jgi:hypothetical protein